MMRDRVRKRVPARLLASAMLVATVVLATPMLSSAAKPAAEPARDSIYQLPEQLIDQDGRSFDWGSRRGKPQVLSMFYTSCRYVCPLIVDSGKAIEKSLTPAQRKQLGILLISMDPANDDPQALTSVANKRKLDHSLWTLASPQPDQVRAIAGILGIRYRALADGDFNHSSALILLDAQGRIITRSEQVGSKLDPEFVAAVHKAIAAP